MKYIYTEKELPQKSDKWLEFRLQQGVGASQVPALFKKCPPWWGNPYDNFLEKMGKAPAPFVEDMERGQFEDQARKYIENYFNKGKKEGVDSVFSKNVYDRTENIDIEKAYFKQYTVIHKEHPEIFASFDGIDIKNKLVLEIKCPKDGIFKKLLRNRVPKVPITYIHQVQTQLEIANSHWGITKGIFGVFYPEGFYNECRVTKKVELIRLILIEVDLDKEFTTEIVRTCKNFMQMVNKKRWRDDWNAVK